MTPGWGPAQPWAHRSDYLHWAETVALPSLNAGRSPDEALALCTFELTEAHLPDAACDLRRGPEGSGPVKVPLPVPGFAINPAFAATGKAMPPDRGPDLTPDLALPDDLAPDTVIVGVVDVDIPLGHRRLSDSDGRSRILAAWQMIAPPLPRQPYLPFGRELYRGGIDALRRRFGRDEAGFNTACGTLDLRHEKAPRGLAGRASHGAHVLDLAAGADPDDPALATYRRRVKVIAVNIPSAAIFGAEGTYLDDFALLALQRIVTLSDEMFRRSAPRWSAPQRAAAGRGFPVVINLSFGKQAGSRAATEEFARVLGEMAEARKAAGLAPVDIVMPTGNDNQQRCFAVIDLTDDTPQTLTLRVQPEDQSANFAETWADLPAGSAALPLDIAVAPPGSGRAAPVWLSLAPGEYRSLEGPDGLMARVYCSVHDTRPGAMVRRQVKLTLCLPPTRRQGVPGPVTPAGAWRLHLRRAGGQPVTCRLSVQTDQPGTTASPRNRRAYFDMPGYLQRDGTGRLAGACLYDAVSMTETEDPVSGLPDHLAQPVRRHGTLNASASHEAVIVVAGYRLGDGQPAVYSGTGGGVYAPAPQGMNRTAPDAACPTETAPSLFGILAAGSADGSAVAMRGTSFAAPQAVRAIVSAHCAETAPGRDGKALLAAQAQSEGLAASARYPRPAGLSPERFNAVMAPVFGAGRLPLMAEPVAPPGTRYRRPAR